MYSEVSDDTAEAQEDVASCQLACPVQLRRVRENLHAHHDDNNATPEDDAPGGHDPCPPILNAKSNAASL